MSGQGEWIVLFQVVIILDCKIQGSYERTMSVKALPGGRTGLPSRQEQGVVFLA